VPDGVHGAVAADGTQATDGNAVLHGAGTEPQRSQLLVRDDPSLACREVRDGVVAGVRVTFGLHVGL
jgi:hypothetical protein